MPDGVWTPLIQAITLHTDWNPEYWQLGLTPWSDWQFVASSLFLYLVGIGLVRWWMQGRSAYPIAALTGFYCISRVSFQNYGFMGAFCTSEPETTIKGRVILKKHPIRAVHVFHQLTALPLAWAWLEDRSLFAIWIVLLDSASSLASYYFYAQSAMDQPVKFKWYITMGQTAQYAITFVLGGIYLIARQLNDPSSMLSSILGQATVHTSSTDHCRGGDGAFWLTLLVHGIMFVFYSQLLHATANEPIPDMKPDASIVDQDASTSQSTTTNTTTTAVASTTSTTAVATTSTATKRKGKGKSRRT
ncbi:hypothetical protein BDF22DRAFT_744852 [Syncephalis plumigaleata]|nr:hypothetical protein BDF22DRAFT_744852 [Syncephalis plumigaleata]